MQGAERDGPQGLPVLARLDSLSGGPQPVSPGHPTPTPDELFERGDSLQEFLGLLARRKLVVLLTAIITPLAALGYSLLQDPLYEASASVLATSGSGLSQLPGVTSTDDNERFAATQVMLARLPIVAERVVKARSPPRGLGHLHRAFSVSAEEDADILSFSVTDPDPAEATRLATMYARAFTNYRKELDVQSIRSTRSDHHESARGAGSGGQA